MGHDQRTIIVCVTGSIAAYRSAEVVRQLRKCGYAVKVVMTQEAEYFIGKTTLEALSGEKVWTAMFDKEAWQGALGHIELAKADLVLVAPATANVIGKIASGIADDLTTCLVMATTAPVVFAPAMNEKMYNNPIVQENCQKLKKHGAYFVGPATGDLACGVHGTGHIADTEDIVEAVRKIVP